MHEWFAGEGGDPIYPMPWARDDGTSFLEPWDAARGRLELRGFEVGPLELQTESGLEMATKRRAEILERAKRGEETDPVSASWLTISEAMTRNLREDRLRVGLAIARKPVNRV